MVRFHDMIKNEVALKWHDFSTKPWAPSHCKVLPPRFQKSIIELGCKLESISTRSIKRGLFGPSRFIEPMIRKNR